MSAEVVDFTGMSTLPISPERILRAALDHGLTQVVICGFDADGNDYFASSEPDAAVAGFHLDRAKWNLMRQVDRMVEGEE
jgi:hypothetical protein